MEYEAYQAGTLAEILVPEGQNADIGAPIALLDDGTGLDDGAGWSRAVRPRPGNRSPGRRCEREQQPPAPPAAPAPAQPSAPPAPPAATPAQAPTPTAAPPTAQDTAHGADDGRANGGGRQIASPLVRKLARENHLDLSHVTGSGPGGRVIRADITGLLAGWRARAGNRRPARTRDPRERRRGR